MSNFCIHGISQYDTFQNFVDMESHGGSTYCAVAALSLMGTLDVLSRAQLDKLVRWCVLRLNIGYQVCTFEL